MDFIFEFLLQVIVEVIGEALLELGCRGASRVLRSSIGRYAVSVLVGFGSGAWWGSYLADAGSGHRPRLFWVSIGVGLASSLAAVARARRPRLTGMRAFRAQLEPAVAPWQWPAYRLWGFAVLNFAIAAGIAVGYSPPSPG